jgi:sugar lactone lactonase YvrE
MTREITAEQATAAVAEHGEGPVWDASRGVLASVDMLRGDLLTVDLLRDGAELAEVRRRHVGDVLAALRPRARGGWVVALERGFGLLDEPGSSGEGAARPLGELWSDPGIRMNDGGCDPAGGFWCGSMAYDDSTPGRGSLYRLAPDGSVATMLTGVTVSNGLCWAPDGSRAYYVDSGTGGIDVLTVDLAAPAVTSRERFVDVEGGTPDGLTVDADGGVWVALWGGSAVHRYTPHCLRVRRSRAGRAVDHHIGDRCWWAGRPRGCPVPVRAGCSRARTAPLSRVNHARPGKTVRRGPGGARVALHGSVTLDDQDDLRTSHPGWTHGEERRSTWHCPRSLRSSAPRP